MHLAGRHCPARCRNRSVVSGAKPAHAAVLGGDHLDSDYPETGYDIDTLTEDIRQFMDCLKIEQIILAGHSLAGIELSHFAALYPERVQWGILLL